MFVSYDSEFGAATSRWCYISDTVWDGPESLRAVPRISQQYPLQRLLFSHHLGVSDATLKTIVAEAKQVSMADSLEHIRAIFRTISHMMRGTGDSEINGSGVSDLWKFQVFPVWSGTETGTFDFIQMGGRWDPWFIADRQHLFDAFIGKVRLFAFEVKEIHDLEPLIQLMSPVTRKLSTIATAETHCHGEKKLKGLYTAMMTQKAKYFARYVRGLIYDLLHTDLTYIGLSRKPDQTDWIPSPTYTMYVYLRSILYPLNGKSVMGLMKYVGNPKMAVQWWPLRQEV